MNTQSTAPAAPRENLSRGIFGAILFALAGGITYYVFWTVGIIAALSGLIGVICAIKGYEIFAGGSSKRGIAISVGAAAAVLVLTWYVCVCLDAHAVYEEMYALGEIEAVPPVAWCLANGLAFIPANPAALWDLLVSLGLAALGCWGYVARAVRLREEIEAPWSWPALKPSRPPAPPRRKRRALRRIARHRGAPRRIARNRKTATEILPRKTWPNRKK